MKKSQVKGYILEIVLAKLLKVNGYDLIKTIGNDIVQKGNGLNVKGRGGYHQFDSLGTFRVTPPFVYPIRLFLEAKFYADNYKVGIERVRMGVGILQDVNTNYSTVHMTNEDLKSPKYHYNYAIFSTSGFTEDAQLMAIAHKIYLMDLSSGYYRWIKDFINQIVDRLFNINGITGENIEKDIFNNFKKDFSRWIDNSDSNLLYRWMYNNYQETIISEFKNRLDSTGSIYIANTKSSQIIALIPDNDRAFRESLRNNPHQEVTITWMESEVSTWIVRPVGDNGEYRLTFQLPQVIQDYIFDNTVNQYDSAYNEKRESFGLLSFIAYLDNENPTLCTLKFNERATKIFIERHNQQFRLENRTHD